MHKKTILKIYRTSVLPKKVGAILGQRFIPSKHMLHGGKWIHYAEVCTWYGALRYAEVVGDKKLIKQLQDRFDLLFIHREVISTDYEPCRPEYVRMSPIGIL